MKKEQKVKHTKERALKGTEIKSEHGELCVHCVSSEYWEPRLIFLPNHTAMVCSCGHISDKISMPIHLIPLFSNLRARCWRPILTHSLVPVSSHLNWFFSSRWHKSFVCVMTWMLDSPVEFMCWNFITNVRALRGAAFSKLWSYRVLMNEISGLTERFRELARFFFSPFHSFCPWRHISSSWGCSQKAASWKTGASSHQTQIVQHPDLGIPSPQNGEK